SVNAQNAWMDINGKSHSWFCGAYWGNGFHEDAVVSAQRVSKSLEGDTL
ncbi:MAG: putative NAD/FAD-binding protein, partial [Gammaproteobacteria bacterium]